LRHAKAAQEAPVGGGDHERPLSPRGRRDAAALGRVLVDGGLDLGDVGLPTYVLCSTAVRTTETAERVVAALGVTLDRRRRLYYGAPSDVLDEVRTLPDDVVSAMVVGHNPTTAELAQRLLVPGDEGLSILGGHGFPTCGLALVRLPAVHWLDVADGTGALEAFFTPPY
jgi:phosphohistidine phosphatase